MTRYAIAALALTVLAGASQAQRLYKWVDENGNVYYSDKVPPEHVSHAREEFNDQGIVIDRLDRAPTAEEIAAMEAEAQRERDEAERRRIQRLEDEQLMATYASEEDIIRRRDQRLDSIDRQIEAYRAFINGQGETLATLMQRAARTEESGKDVDEKLRGNISKTQQQIQEKEEAIARQLADKDRVREQYDEELARYRDLLERHASNAR